MIGYPGQIFTPEYRYDPRWYYGYSGDMVVVSCLATEFIAPGSLVEAVATGNPNVIGVQNARGTGAALVGVAAFDPAKYFHDVVYEQNDMIPVLRKGSIFCAFTTNLPPFANPAPFKQANFYANVAAPAQVPIRNVAYTYSPFTTDATGNTNAQIAFSVANKDYYNNADGSPAADIPYPIPPQPPDISATTFGAGCALVDVNLG